MAALTQYFTTQVLWKLPPQVQKCSFLHQSLCQLSRNDAQIRQFHACRASITPLRTFHRTLQSSTGARCQLLAFARCILPASFSTSLRCAMSTTPRRGMTTAESRKLTSVMMYVVALGVFMTGMAYAGVPLYRMFCAASGTGTGALYADQTHGTPLENLEPVRSRQITIKFNADTASSMLWNFRPQQPEVLVAPGETALAFYKATNPTDKPIIGISTYNIIPYEAGPYFNKIQCFCFEEQRLNPHEEVDMPVFFYIDPEYNEDPKLETIDEIMLSYTFFESKEGMTLPLPGYMQ